MMIPRRSMVRESRLYNCSGNHPFLQFHSIRMILMISSVLPFATIQNPRNLGYRWCTTCTSPGLHKSYCTVNVNILARSYSSVVADMCTNSGKDNKNVTSGRADDFNDESVNAAPKIQSHVESSFATHVLITDDESPISVVDVVHKVLSSIQRSEDKTELSAVDLIRFGSVWYLSSSDVDKHGTYNPSSGVKPLRLTSPFAATIGNTIPNENDTLMMLNNGDYLRIHHNPRRFRMVSDYDWGKFIDYEENSNRNATNDTYSMTSSSNSEIEKVGVIVAADPRKGWVIVNKPAGIPVHMTVDNAVENVASCLKTAMISRRSQGNENLQFDESSSSSEGDQRVYVATPQRLDQNTSGLLVVATKKMFASYFAQLLRYKTAELLIHHENETSQSSSLIGGVNKLYRCLVCLVSPQPTTMIDSGGITHLVAAAESELQSYVQEQRVMRHYLEPSIRAPKRFVSERPLHNVDEYNTTSSSTNEWPEALLKIRKASRVYAVSGNESAVNFARSLWSSSTYGGSSNNSYTDCSMPDNCHAVIELEIELLTGRTHQIRGQLAACNFPLVGDIQYGGAKQPPNFTKLSLITERLALQCCELEFIDPDIVATQPKWDGSYEHQMIRSKRWNSFRIDKAWWTPYLDCYEQQCDMATEINSDSISFENVTEAIESALINNTKPARPELLPPRVSLSRGANKYVLIRAIHPATPTLEEWFVKSSTTTECGGPYHGNVAQDLREWIEALGYDATVTGGGRINYRITSDGQRLATIYGFSNGFGRGDHTKAAAIIKEWSNGEIVTFIDSAVTLY